MIGSNKHNSVYNVKNKVRLFLSKILQEDKKLYALKEISKETLKDKQSVNVLKQQIEKNLLFNNDNIDKIVAIYESKSSVYIILNLFAGNQLINPQNDSSKIFESSENIREIMQNIIQIMVSLEKSNIVHRKILPSSFKLSDKGKNFFVNFQEVFVIKINTKLLHGGMP